MSNHGSFDDEQVFDKLQKEASRHRRSTVKTNKYTVPSTIKSQEYRDRVRKAREQRNRMEPISGHDSKEKVVPENRKKTASKDSPITKEGMSKTAGKTSPADLQNEIRQAVGPITDEVTVTRRRVKNHSKKRKSSSPVKNAGKKNRKPGKRWPRIVGLILALALAIGIGGYGFVVSKLNKIERTDGQEDTVNIDDEFDRENEYGIEDYKPKLITSEDVTNILLIGQDRRKGDAARMRSDSMIVCSINKKTKEITLTSLMRDMYLPIPGKGYGMINATYLSGGFDLLNQTIEKNFGIRIDGNVEVDFDRFVGLMTLIGPIDLELSQAEADHLNQAGYNLRPGVNTLDSEQVLAYCRMRKDIGGDWGRTDRQRKVVSRIYQELKTSGLSTIYRFIDEALPLFRTDLTNRKMIQLAYAMVSGRMGIRHSYRLPKEGTYTQEIREETLHVLIPDIRKNSALMQDYIYGYLQK